jgi:NAD(P)-dependent dehydrogenase (short-subunit alcohol dehydrogenase family)
VIDMDVKGSTALVTGASRGIGRTLVEELLARGAARVYAGSRRPDGWRNPYGDPRVVPLALDVTDVAQIAAAAARADDVTLLVNNAGSMAFADPLAGDLADIEADWRTNYLGPVVVTRAFAPVLERNGGGAVVNVLSLIAFAPVPMLSGYSASKAAAASATQALRAQLAGRGITVHGVFPGAVDTEMSRELVVPKTRPAEVAVAILDAVEAGETEVFPDPMARDGYAAWRADPAALARQLASL